MIKEEKDYLISLLGREIYSLRDAIDILQALIDGVSGDKEFSTEDKARLKTILNKARTEDFIQHVDTMLKEKDLNKVKELDAWSPERKIMESIHNKLFGSQSLVRF